MHSIVVFQNLILYAILHLTPIVNGFNGRCPVEWTHFDGYCYRLERTLLSFAAAQTKCETDGASLVSVTSAEENRFVTDLGILGEKPFYIGLNDIADERTFEWTDGSPFRYDQTLKEQHCPSTVASIPQSPFATQPPRIVSTGYCRQSEIDFSNWNFNKANPEPNNYGSGEDCIHIIYSTDTPSVNGLWNDIPCHHPRYSMCKKEASEEGTLEETTIKCPHSFETFIELGTPTKSISWSETSYIANSQAAHVERSHSPGVELRKGVTRVNYTYRDAYNLTATCNFSINVVEMDTTPPSINGCPPDVVLSQNPWNIPVAVKWIPPTSTDLSGNVTLVSQSHTPGDQFDIGLTLVNYTFADITGNEAECHFKIYVFEAYTKEKNESASASSSTYYKSNGLYNLVLGLYVMIVIIGLCVAFLMFVRIRQGSSSKTRPSFSKSYSKTDEENLVNCEVY